MRLSQILFHQHIGRMFRDHWKVQGKKVVYDNGSLRAAIEKGIKFENALDFINEKPIEREILPPLDEYRLREPPADHSHPDYQTERCLTYSNHNVLLEGLQQAQVLTNTTILDPAGLPLTQDILAEQDIPLQDKLVRRCIRSSLLFDAWQEKLPKRTNPEKEAWNYPRDYGITDRRRNYLLVKRLLQLCSSLSPQLLGQRVILDSAVFKLPYIHPSGHRLLFSLRGDAVLLSEESPSIGTTLELPPSQEQLPNLSPLAPTVSLDSTNIYKFESYFPIEESCKLDKIHTVVIHYNETEVANLFDCPVRTDQILGRTLVHSWVYAMCQALKNGKEEAPVTVQTVQTDGKFFHFGVFNLCSTSLDKESSRNYFWSFPLMNLFENCSYVDGIPKLEGYNPKVFKTLLAFYNNS